MKTIFYKPHNAFAADAIPFYHNGEFYIYYLQDFRDAANHGDGISWYLLKTKDFVNYEEMGEVLPCGNEDEQDLRVYTGCVFEHGGKFYIFYTGHNDRNIPKGIPQEKIMLAESDDLLHWRKRERILLEPPAFVEKHDFRDPFVFFDGERYNMLLAARYLNGPFNRKGVTLCAVSDNLYDWTVLEQPFYAPNKYFTHECPDRFVEGEYEYLLFSEFSDVFRTHYRYRKLGSESWITPVDDVFDNRAFYAAKTVSDGKRRFLIGWIPTRNEDKDYGYWHWGGALTVRELAQNSDGTLRARCYDAKADFYKESLQTELDFTLGNVYGDSRSVMLSSAEGFAACLFETGLQGDFMLQFDFSIDKQGEFGIIFKSDKQLNNCYKLRFIPAQNKIVFDREPRNCCDNVQMPELERYFVCKAGVKHSCKLFVGGECFELYVDDCVALSGRAIDFKETHAGFFASECNARVMDIIVKK